MARRTDLKIPYGVADFKTIRNEGLYYVDKTMFLAKIEERDRFVFFVRPRRFGKSLFVSMLQSYYDRREKANFEKLFDGLWIGAHPTGNRNRYLVLKLDFSEVGGMGGETLESKFANYMDAMLDDFMARYADLFPAGAFASVRQETKFKVVVNAAKASALPLFLIVDEYDNFTNALIRQAGKDPYRTITHGTGFYREWFKLFKSSFDRIFMTGVSPVTMDDLTSGFNIAANISQDQAFNAMLGFTEEETRTIYRDFKGVGAYQEGDPERIVAAIKPWYDGYCFSKQKIGKESVFNSDMVFYHLKSLVAEGVPPENMVDVNISTDYDKLETIVDLQRQAGAQNALPSVGELIDGVPFEIRQTFDFERMARPELFPTVLQNEGILSPVRYSQGQVYYSFPNVAASLAYLYLVNGWNRATDSYIVELKYSKPKDSDEQVAAKAQEGILYHFKGTELIRLEEIPV